MFQDSYKVQNLGLGFRAGFMIQDLGNRILDQGLRLKGGNLWDQGVDKGQWVGVKELNAKQDFVAQGRGKGFMVLQDSKACC